MKIVLFTRHQPPFMAGERAAFAPAVAGRYEAAKVGQVVGSVDDKGRILAHELAGEPPGTAEDGTEPAPTRAPRGGRQA